MPPRTPSGHSGLCGRVRDHSFTATTHPTGMASCAIGAYLPGSSACCSASSPARCRSQRACWSASRLRKLTPGRARPAVTRGQAFPRLARHRSVPAGQRRAPHRQAAATAGPRLSLSRHPRQYRHRPGTAGFPGSARPMPSGRSGRSRRRHGARRQPRHRHSHAHPHSDGAEAAQPTRRGLRRARIGTPKRAGQRRASATR